MKRSVEMESEDSFNGFDSEEDAVSMLSKRFKTNASSDGERISQERKISRKPTRQPDPAVTNRNALMARENRRKHKERLELLEAQNEALFEKNVALETRLKVKDMIIQDLRRELMHLKSVIANKTQITQILGALQSSGLPMTSSITSASLPYPKSPSTESTASAVSSGYESPSHATLNANNGTLDPIGELLREAFDSQNLTFTDYEMNTNALATDEWSYSAETNSIFPDLTASIFDDEGESVTTAYATTAANIKTGGKIAAYEEEHNYSEPGTSDPGVCVHISNQKVSIEFCSRCHTIASGLQLSA